MNKPSGREPGRFGRRGSPMMSARARLLSATIGPQRAVCPGAVHLESELPELPHHLLLYSWVQAKELKTASQ